MTRTPSTSVDVFGRAVQHVKYGLPSYLSDAVVKDLAERDRIGRRTYGVPLMSHNGRDPLIDLYEELLDALVYSTQWDAERGRATKGEITTELIVLVGEVANRILLREGSNGILANREPQPLPEVVYTGGTNGTD